MRPIIHTKKHYVQESFFTILSGAIRNDIVVNAIAEPDVTKAEDVIEGAIISAVYFEMWLTSDDGTLGTTIVTVEKLPGLGAGPLMASGDAAALQFYDNKKNVFYTQMGLVGSNAQYPSNVIKGWVKIPKSKQRFGLEDRLVLNILAQSNGLTGCGFALYKEQT